MLVSRTYGQFLHVAAPDFSRQRLIKELEEGGISTFKVISEWLASLVIERELDLHAEFIDIEVDDF